MDHTASAIRNAASTCLDLLHAGASDGLQQAADTLLADLFDGFEVEAPQPVRRYLAGDLSGWEEAAALLAEALEHHL